LERDGEAVEDVVRLPGRLGLSLVWGERVPGGGGELFAGRVALLGRFRQRPLEHRVERGPQLGAAPGHSRWRLGQMRFQDCLGRVARERRPAGEALEEEAAEGVHVRAGSERSSLDLLGGRVAVRAQPRGGFGERGRGRQLPSQAETHEQRAFAREQNLARPQVPVHEPARPPGPVKRPSQPDRERERPGGLEPPLPFEQAPQVRHAPAQPRGC
jgi:hypothetical protein